MGIPGQFHHPAFLDAMHKVVTVGRQHGLGLGIQPRNMAQAQEWAALGFNVMSYSADIFAYLDAMTQGVAEMRKLVVS
jgi:2-dehydro-3-deoxyglucarate aldolase/4-hydroxy-2-oxoheptanedioate aldolase